MNGNVLLSENRQQMEAMMASIAEYDQLIQVALEKLSSVDGDHDQAIVSTYTDLIQRVDDGELLQMRLYVALAKKQLAQKT